MSQNLMSNSGNICPACKGMGWETYDATVYDYGLPKIITYARSCSKCSGSRHINDKTGVPGEFCDADIGKFRWDVYGMDLSKMQKVIMSVFNQWQQWHQCGKGIYLWSKTPGSGKTFLACCMAKSIMLKYDLQMRFITAPDYIAAVGDSYKRERGERDPTQVYRECALLVLDDIGAQTGKEWQQQEMFRLINQRVSNGLVTIFTSNLHVEQLNVDDRTKDRIIKASVVIQMPEESIRRRKAEHESNEFLKSVL